MKELVNRWRKSAEYIKKMDSENATSYSLGMRRGVIDGIEGCADQLEKEFPEWIRWVKDISLIIISMINGGLIVYFFKY